MEECRQVPKFSPTANNQHTETRHKRFDFSNICCPVGCSKSISPHSSFREVVSNIALLPSFSSPRADSITCANVKTRLLDCPVVANANSGQASGLAPHSASTPEPPAEATPLSPTTIASSLRAYTLFSLSFRFLSLPGDVPVGGGVRSRMTWSSSCRD